MTQKRAIRALKIQKDKLPSELFGFGSTWIIQTKSYLYSMIEQGDVLVENFKQIENGVKYSTAKGLLPNDIAGYKNSFSTILQSAMEKIEYTGLKESGKTNFLYRINGSVLTTLFIGVLGFTYFLGSSIGKYLSDTQNIELKRENALLRESAVALSNKIKVGEKKTPEEKSDSVKRVK